MRPRWIRLLAASAACVAALGATAPASAAPRLPASMAALGDSITQAYDVCCSYGAHPERSWSAGTLAGDAVTSHYERLLAVDPAIAGNVYDDAAAGAQVADLAGQAQQAVAQRAQYVTILIGANDVCTGTVAQMTPAAVFRQRFAAALATLEQGLPARAHVFVASIPDVYRLWAVLRTNPNARAIWWLADICQSLLAPHRTSAERRAVRAQVVADNGQLRQACAAYRNCRYDGGAVFRHCFSAAEVSALDYFHPSPAGQAALADVTWQASWWPGQP